MKIIKETIRPLTECAVALTGAELAAQLYTAERTDGALVIIINILGEWFAVYSPAYCGPVGYDVEDPSRLRADAANGGAKFILECDSVIVRADAL